jgi:uncharacterized delta-60 repeat protein
MRKGVKLENIENLNSIINFIILGLYIMSTDLDLTFNTPNGFLTTTFNTLVPEPLPQDVAVSVLIRSDNRIVMGGYSTYSTGPYITLSCYNTDGSLYTTFGVGGKVLLPAPSGFFTSCIVHDVILQPNDYIIVTGDTSSPDPAPFFRPSMFVARFTPLGVLDTTFNSPSGYVIIPPSAFDSGGNFFDQCYSNSVIIQPSDGYIVLGGSVRKLALPNNKSFIALVRLTATGALDTLFGTNLNGTVYAAFNLLTNNEDICNCLSIQTDGKIVSGGVNSPAPSPPASQNLSVVRFTTGGILDTTFNSSGITPGWLIIPNLPSYNYNFARGIGINSVGQIIISSYITKLSFETCFGVAAVTSSGILDTSFGTGGQTILDLSPTYNLTAPLFSNGTNALALQSDNKIVITGGFLNTSTFAEGFSLARFDTNGALDLTFGLAGVGYILSDLVSPSTEIGYSVAIQTDGKVLVGGTAVNIEDSGANNSFILARYFGFPPFPIPIISICFPAGTPVLTDQGNIPIEEINPDIHTIKKNPIIAITQSFMNEDTIVCIEKHSLGINIPNKRTFISNYHGIIYKNQLIPAERLVGRLRGIYYVKYNKQVLYNVLMEKHYIINVNNMSVETLNPKNIVAKLYKNEHSPEEKTRLILEINEISKNNRNIKNKKNCENFNGYEKITQNFTRRKFSILRYNPLINRLNFYTKKHFVSQNNPHNNTIKNHVSFKKYNPNVKLNTHKFRYGRRIR